jgi:hypothetical protein
MKTNVEMIMASKQSNSTGSQWVDSIARPIGLNCLRPEQENKSFEVIKERIVSNKVFLDNKKPLWIHNGLVSTANPQSLRGIISFV